MNVTKTIIIIIIIVVIIITAANTSTLLKINREESVHIWYALKACTNACNNY